MVRVKKFIIGFTITSYFLLCICLVLHSSSSDVQSSPNSYKKKNVQYEENKLTEEIQDVQLTIKNFTSEKRNQTFYHPLNPLFPLMGNLKAPLPGYKLGQIKKNCDIIIGITTVKREKESYLGNTLHSLLRNAGSITAQMAIVVYIGETDLDYVVKTCSFLYSKFRKEFLSGKLQIINPPSNYYPDWDNVLQSNFGDNIERVKWRSKQNLDQIFLMMYIYQQRPSYYLMMEDDVFAKNNYMVKIVSEISRHEDKDWFFLSFSELGAIGKLFHSRSLPAYASFLHLFWNKKPLDWLPNDYVAAAYCSFDESARICNLRKQQKMISITPSLFQHVGKYSSLRGKIQQRKDKYFSKSTR